MREYGNESVADIRVCGSELHGIDIEADLVPSAIDDFPALLIAAAAAIGKTTLSGATELRNKESDRIGAMVEGLLALVGGMRGAQRRHCGKRRRRQKKCV